jgi:hypothetical protein
MKKNCENCLYEQSGNNDYSPCLKCGDLSKWRPSNKIIENAINDIFPSNPEESFFHYSDREIYTKAFKEAIEWYEKLK